MRDAARPVGPDASDGRSVAVAPDALAYRADPRDPPGAMPAEPAAEARPLLDDPPMVQWLLNMPMVSGSSWPVGRRKWLRWKCRMALMVSWSRSPCLYEPALR